MGFVSGGRIREPLQGYDAELFAIYLLDRAQGRGLGTALLRKLAESLGTKGFKGMTAWVLERNPAIHFYEKSGAAPVNAKEIEIGGVLLQEVAFAWPDLEGKYDFQVRTGSVRQNDFLERLRSQLNLVVTAAQRNIEILVFQPR